MKRKRIKVLMEYLNIFIGTVIASIAINMFLVPSQLAPGGATGMAILINHLTNISVGSIIFMINIPLFLIGIKVFGKEYGLKTLVGISLLALNVELVKEVVPQINKIIDFSNSGNTILAPLYGGILNGIGLGLVIKNGGTTGGSDIIAGIFNKYFKISMGQSFIMIDSLVIITAGFIFGVEKALFALINLYTTGIVINKIIIGLGNAKMVCITTSKIELVRKIIIEDIGKTGNYYKAEGLYTKQERDIVTVVLRNKEIYLLKELISEVDKEAFVVVSEVHEVLGRGYTF